MALPHTNTPFSCNYLSSAQPSPSTNIFQGTFPGNNLAEDGFEHLCPVDTSSTIPAQNDYGLHHMIGNAWEWVEDWFTQVRNNRRALQQ